MFRDHLPTSTLQELPPEVYILSLVDSFTIASPVGSPKYVAMEKAIRRCISTAGMQQLHTLLPELIHVEPQIQEDTIKYLVPGDKEIAPLKAYHADEAARHREKRNESEPSTPTIRYIAEIASTLLLSYANDVVSTLHTPQGIIVEHKIDPNSTKMDVLAHLQKTIGKSEADDGYLRMDWRLSSAVHEAVTDISVVRQKTHELVLYRASDSFLHALIFGLNDPDHPVDAMVRKQFLRLYSKGTEYSRPDDPNHPDRHQRNWGGWTPEEGMPLAKLLSINGAKPGDSLPFVELLIASVDGLRPTQEGYEIVIQSAIKDVRGQEQDLQYLLRVLISTIATLPTLGDLDVWQGDDLFLSLANQLIRLQQIGQLSGDWLYSGRTRDISGPIEESDLQLAYDLVAGLIA